ncbi:ATP-binding cassette, sub-family F, member 3 [Pseudohyphozyma bogoriensis]|nr:ATP-binding cassette, sub-family F, member 3 [Pseudohyphozyma bogoriensis]
MSNPPPALFTEEENAAIRDWLWPLWIEVQQRLRRGGTTRDPDIVALIEKRKAGAPEPDDAGDVFLSHTIKLQGFAEEFSVDDVLSCMEEVVVRSGMKAALRGAMLGGSAAHRQALAFGTGIMIIGIDRNCGRDQRFYSDLRSMPEFSTASSHLMLYGLKGMEVVGQELARDLASRAADREAAAEAKGKRKEFAASSDNRKKNAAARKLQEEQAAEAARLEEETRRAEKESAKAAHKARKQEREQLKRKEQEPKRPKVASRATSSRAVGGFSSDTMLNNDILGRTVRDKSRQLINNSRQIHEANERLLATQHHLSQVQSALMSQSYTLHHQHLSLQKQQASHHLHYQYAALQNQQFSEMQQLLQQEQEENARLRAQVPTGMHDEEPSDHEQHFSPTQGNDPRRRVHSFLSVGPALHLRLDFMSEYPEAKAWLWPLWSEWQLLIRQGETTRSGKFLALVEARQRTGGPQSETARDMLLMQTIKLQGLLEFHRWLDRTRKTTSSLSELSGALDAATKAARKKKGEENKWKTCDPGRDIDDVGDCLREVLSRSGMREALSNASVRAADASVRRNMLSEAAFLTIGMDINCGRDPRYYEELRSTPDFATIAQDMWTYVQTAMEVFEREIEHGLAHLEAVRHAAAEAKQKRKEFQAASGSRKENSAARKLMEKQAAEAARVNTPSAGASIFGDQSLPHTAEPSYMNETPSSAADPTATIDHLSEQLRLAQLNNDILGRTVKDKSRQLVTKARQIEESRARLWAMQQDLGHVQSALQSQNYALHWQHMSLHDQQAYQHQMNALHAQYAALQQQELAESRQLLRQEQEENARLRAQMPPETYEEEPFNQYGGYPTPTHGLPRRSESMPSLAPYRPERRSSPRTPPPSPPGTIGNSAPPARTGTTATMATFSSLPLETLESIITFALCNQPPFRQSHDLHNFSLVSRLWTHTSQSRLFRTTSLVVSEEADKFRQLVKGSTRVAAYVRKVVVGPKPMYARTEGELGDLGKWCPRLTEMELAGLRGGLDTKSMPLLASRLTTLVLRDIQIDTCDFPLLTTLTLHNVTKSPSTTLALPSLTSLHMNCTLSPSSSIDIKESTLLNLSDLAITGDHLQDLSIGRLPSFILALLDIPLSTPPTLEPFVALKSLSLLADSSHLSTSFFPLLDTLSSSSKLQSLTITTDMGFRDRLQEVDAMSLELVDTLGGGALIGDGDGAVKAGNSAKEAIWDELEELVLCESFGEFKEKESVTLPKRVVAPPANDSRDRRPSPMASQILNNAVGGDLDYPIIEYIDTLFSDADADDQDDPIGTFVRPLLETYTPAQVPEDINDICIQLEQIWTTLTGNKIERQPAKLDKVLDMRRQEILSKRQAVTQVVDIASVVKARETQVNIKALEKAEAKIKAKMEKRDRKNAYEGSKLIDASKGQKSYEELYLEVNPFQSAASNKGKSKDIHLENIDVNFGSLRILSNATVTLSEGRRYGLIGRNGIGKSTLLRAMALREVAVPQHITILYVQQEVIGDDTPALESVLQADVHRTRMMKEEKQLNADLQALEDAEANGEDSEKNEKKKAELMSQLKEVQDNLVEIDADTGPSRAAELLAGLGFDKADQDRPTKSFSGGWRMRLSLARALFCKPDLLLLDEPSNNLDLNALAWLEDYLQTWPYTLLVVSHDRSFLDAVATDIIYQHNERLDYYKGNFNQFYATKSERDKNQKKEYEAQVAFRAHLQAFIDRWRYNAKRASLAQSKMKVLEKLPDLQPPDEDDVVKFKFLETEKISPPLLQLSEVGFGYSKDKPILAGVNISVDLDSRLGLIGANGAGKSTLMKLLIGELNPTTGQQQRNGRLRIAYFAQHHIDSLELNLSSVAFLAKMFPGKTEQEYRGHLGAFGITGMTSLQLIGTLSGGQKSRVSFATLSLQQPHILLLDEPTNHLDIEGLDALMAALKVWNGGVIVISHDTTFINTVCNELWVVGNGKAEKFYGDVSEYKNLIVANAKNKPT